MVGQITNTIANYNLNIADMANKSRGEIAYTVLNLDHKVTPAAEEKLAQIEALNKMAGERGQSLAQMALSWILKDEDVTSVLIGASRPEQIIQNVEIVQNTKFTREELKKIDQISRGDL